MDSALSINGTRQTGQDVRNANGESLLSSTTTEPTLDI
jgi:hypothetical protein